MATTLTLYTSIGGITGIGAPLSFSQVDNNWIFCTRKLAIWDSTFTYSINDLTTYLGIQYVAVLANTGLIPPANSTNWHVASPAHVHNFSDIISATVDDGAMASPSHVLLPTQASVKTYVDAQVGTISSFGVNQSIDAVGGTTAGKGLISSATITWSYNSGLHQITGIVATGSLTATQLSTPSAPTTGQVLSYSGSSLAWTNPLALKYYVEPSASPATSPILSGTTTGSIVMGDGASITAALYARVGGGLSNVINGSTTSADYAIIATGLSNQINNSPKAGIFGGESNGITAGADHALILNGNTNTITSASYGSIINGQNHTMDSVSIGATILNGSSNACVGAPNSTVSGKNGKAIFPSQVVVSMTQFAAAGDSQSFIVPLKIATTDATTTNMLADSSTQSSLPSTGTWAFRISISARQTGGASGTAGDSAIFFLTGGVKVVAGSATIIGSTNIQTFTEAATAAWTAQVSTASGNLQVRVTGEVSKNVRWSGSINCSQVMS